MQWCLAGAVSFSRSRVTMQSAPGHWAVLSSPINDPIGSVNVISIRFGSDYGVLRNLEVTGESPPFYVVVYCIVSRHTD